MNLCSIFNVWSDVDLLKAAISNHFDCGINAAIVIYSNKSNYGELESFNEFISVNSIYFFNREPQSKDATTSETDKRNFGLQKARELRFTHFLSCDADEFYDPIEFAAIKKRFADKRDLQGIVCPSIVYFKKPTLSIGKDITLVPHIHKLTPNIKHTFNRAYPNAFDGRQIRIDPTRSFNINSGVEFTSEITMHHFSHVRKDYEKKLRNSSAKFNLDRSSIREDYANAAPGYFCRFYQKTLVEVPDRFGIGNI